MKHTPGPWLSRLQDLYAWADSHEDITANDHPNDAMMVKAIIGDMVKDATATIEALRECHFALGLVTDFPSATGENPDVQNRALDNAEAVIAKATGGAL